MDRRSGRHNVKKIGAKVLASLYFEIGGTDFTSAISKLKNLNPDVVFNIASTTEAALIQKQAKELDYYTQWIGVGGQFTQAYFKMTGPLSEYAMGSSLEPDQGYEGSGHGSLCQGLPEKISGEPSRHILQSRL